MRSVLTISLPLKKKNEVVKRARRFTKSVSAYILHAIELEQQLISEDELVQMVEQAEADYKKGKTKPLKSLAALKK